MPVVCRRPRPGALLRALLTASFLFLVGSCGSTTYYNGTPVVVMTGTNSHFTSFIVSIDSITLTRDDGNIFNGLTLAEQVDLSRVVDVSQLLEAPAIPTGNYKQGTITLDFSAPVITYDSNGQSVGLTPTDNSGAALSAVTLTFNFDPSHPLVINYQQGVNLGLEFDLAASTIVNPSAGTVAFTPMVVVSTQLANNNPVAVRGLFLITQPGSSQFVMNSLPAYDYNLYGATFGAVNVVIDSNTAYDLNGVPYIGTAGLAAMSALPLNSVVGVRGTITDISGVTPVLHATQVLAGNSQEGPLVDHVNGTVSARSGNTVTLHNALEILRGSAFQSYGLPVVYFYNDATVVLGSSTIVTTDGSGATGTPAAAISVGQQIEAIGQASNDQTSGALTMDTTQGEVRVQSTRVWGTLTSATPGSLQTNLAAIGPAEIPAYNFAGTGASSASDTNPASYIVNTGTLDESATPTNTPLRIDGLVAPFGSAPPDFNATAVATSPAVDSLLQVEWPAGTLAPFSSSSSSGLVVDLANAAITSATIDMGPFSVPVSSLSATPTIVPDPNGTNFSVGAGTPAVMNTFLTFAGLVTQIGTELAASHPMHKLVAVGHYDPGTNTFIAKQVDLAEL
jgi:hypothetical protein